MKKSIPMKFFKNGLKFKDKTYYERLKNFFSKIHSLKCYICINSCSSVLHLTLGAPVCTDVNAEKFLIDENF